MGFTSASFLVTEKCNMSCKYCFERDFHKNHPCEDMSYLTATKGVNWLYQNALNEEKKKSVGILLFGGEPLMRPDVCAKIFDQALIRKKETGIDFNVNLITNGTLFNKDIEYFLLKYSSLNPHFSCQISLDGVQEAHDMYRVYPNGKGSFEKIVSSLKNFQYIFKDKLTLHGCVNKKTLPFLYESYEYFYKELGSRRIWFMPVHTEDWNEEDVSIYDEQLSQIYEHIIKHKAYDVFAPINRCLSHNRTSQPNRTCGVGNTFVSFTASGDIYPCHNIYFNDPKKTQYLGSLYNNMFDLEKMKPYAEYSTKTMGCSDCENTECYRCIADNHVVNGDINKQVGKPFRCKMSSIEFKYQKFLREHVEKTVVPKDLEEARARKVLRDEVKKLSHDMVEVKAALKLLLERAYSEELEPYMNPEKGENTDGNSIDPVPDTKRTDSEGCI